MPDFNELWTQMASNRYADPVKQKEFEQSRLETLTTAAVTQALWKSARARFLFMLIGFIVVPPFGFHIAALPFPVETYQYGLVGVVGYVLGAVAVWVGGKRVLEGDADAELERALQPVLAAEAAFAAKWARKAR